MNTLMMEQPQTMHHDEQILCTSAAEAMANDLMRLAVLYAISMLEEDKYCGGDQESEDTELAGWAWMEADRAFKQREWDVSKRWDVVTFELAYNGVLQEVGYNAGIVPMKSPR